MPQTATTELPPLTVWKLLHAGSPKARLPLVRQVCQAFGLHKMNLKVAADGKYCSCQSALKRTQATNLSAGQKQRVALAVFFIRRPSLRAIDLAETCADAGCGAAVLAMKPGLALMDEPTSLLDGASNDEVEVAARVRGCCVVRTDCAA
jgi:ABC-type Mn2+/Zn2+ transport system ATPase subunit